MTQRTEKRKDILQTANQKINKKRYRSKLKKLSIEFSLKENDITEYLDTKPNKSGYVKNLIRADMESDGK